MAGPRAAQACISCAKVKLGRDWQRHRPNCKESVRIHGKMEVKAMADPQGAFVYTYLMAFVRSKVYRPVSILDQVVPPHRRARPFDDPCARNLDGVRYVPEPILVLPALAEIYDRDSV